MKKRFDFPVVLLFSALIAGIAGCGAGGVSPTERSSAMEEIDPFEYGDEFAYRPKGFGRNTSGSGAPGGDVEPARRQDGKDVIHPRAETTSASAGTPDMETTDAPSPEHSHAKSVYRVQIGIFEEQKFAEQRAEEARSKVDRKVIIEFEPPFYRVRVGEFLTRREAEEYVKVLQDYGFRGSFWVLKNINTP